MKSLRARRPLPWLLAAAALLGALPLRAQTLCVASNGEGIGGSGRSSSTGSGQGIGGSGRATRGGGEGIGGSGIVGTITGFGSICVNGLEIDVDEARVDLDGRVAAAADLALGQVVAVEALERDAGLSAERVSVSTAVAGPLSRVEAPEGRLELLGQRILVASPVALWDASERRSLTLAELRNGDFVRVSGLRRSDGIVVASRIERSRPDVPRLSGPVELRDDGSVQIGSLRVDPGAARDSLVAGRIVTVAGSLVNGALIPALLRVEPEIPFDGRLRRLSLEGFVQATESGARFRLANLDVDASAFDAASGATPIVRDARIRVLGTLSGEARLLPERIEIEMPMPDAGSIRWTPLPPARLQTDAPNPEPGSPAARMPGPEPAPQRGERPLREGSPERPQLPERAEGPERPELPERAEGPERPELPERAERPERPELPERAERPERPELPERAERPERPELPERPERPERPDRPDRP